MVCIHKFKNDVAVLYCFLFCYVRFCDAVGLLALSFGSGFSDVFSLICRVISPFFFMHFAFSSCLDVDGINSRRVAMIQQTEWVDVTCM